MTDLLADLIETARTERPPPSRQARTWRGVQSAVAAGQVPVVGGGGSALGEALAASSAPSGGLVKIAAVAVVLASTVAAVIATTRPEPTRAVQSVAPAARELAGRPRAELVVPTIDPVPPPILEPSPPPGGVEAAPSVAVRESSPAPENVRESMHLLQRAWETIKSGRPSVALRLVTEHRRTYPKSALAQERAALRIVALCRLGRTARARRALDTFRAAYPHSVHDRRLARDCRDLEKP